MNFLEIFLKKKYLTTIMSTVHVSIQTYNHEALKDRYVFFLAGPGLAGGCMR